MRALILCLLLVACESQRAPGLPTFDLDAAVGQLDLGADARLPDDASAEDTTPVADAAASPDARIDAPLDAVVDAVLDAEPDAGPPPGPPRSVLVQLFEWPWTAVAEECARVLGPAGFAGVQVSPPHEHPRIEDRWWDRYQVVSYQLISRGGDEAEFAEMVRRCRAAGVEIHVDAILNHMAAAPDTEGVAGTPFEKYSYPGLYEREHFHERCSVDDWGDRWQVQNCQLATLPDLATEQDHVRAQLTGYLQRLADLGVAGLRVDAMKHIPAEDLSAIIAPVDPPLELFGEIIALGDDEPVHPAEYHPMARSTEFRYGLDLTRVFTEGQLSWLDNFGEAWGLIPSEGAVVFLDNHDNQRGHGAGEPLTHQSGALYRLANVFMLAWPYGRVKLMSSYVIRGPDHAPPIGGEICDEQWICEHRWPELRAMVAWRNHAGDAPVTNWWDNGNDQIAFGRGDRAFVVINREEAPTLERRFQTGLPEGLYREVIAGGEVRVEANGEAGFTLPPQSARAIHIGAR